MAQRGAGRGRGIISWRQFVALVAVAVGGYFMVSFGNLVVSAYRLNTQAEELRSEIKTLRGENEALQLEVKSLNDEAAIESIARQELGWTRPGEIQVVVDVEPASSVALPPPARSPKQVVPTWRQWLDLVLEDGV